MKEKLSNNKLRYVFFHLSQIVELPQNFSENVYYISKEKYEKSNLNKKIIFLSNSSELNLKKVVYFEDIPILFPNSEKYNAVFFIDKNNNLCFEHDLLKSAFYLISGYQETLSYCYPDKYNRYPFEQSIQHKLNCIQKPLVNYYFKWITDGLDTFYKTKTQNKYKKPTFILTHDIDLIDKYNVFLVGHRLKQMLRISKDKLPFKEATFEFFNAFINFIKIFNRPNPYWCFDFLTKQVPQATKRHIFFFLPKTKLHKNSYYKFTNKRIQRLFAFLQKQNCEIGIHGTLSSYKSFEAMQNIVSDLKFATNLNITANRQHCLMYKMPTTALIHQQCELKEDFSLGFAAHNGFRNSYCHPFKLYDFDNDCPINVWQYPLNVMDGTLFRYRKLTFTEAYISVNKTLDEVKKFNGTFTLLWHNSFLDEKEISGITKFYIDLLKLIDKVLK